MSRDIKRAYELIEGVQKEVRLLEERYFIELEHISRDLEDVADTIDRLQGKIDDAEDEINDKERSLREAQRHLEELEMEMSEKQTFPCVTLEDEGKIAILQRMYEKYTWNELTEIENQHN